MPSEAYKKAAGFPREIGESYYDRFRRLLEMADSQGYSADAIMDLVTQFFRDELDEGLMSPEDIADIGRRIMPDLEEVLSKRRGSISNIRDLAGQVPTARDISERISSEIDQYGQDISRTGDIIQGDITDTSRRAMERESQTTGDIQNRIKQLYQRLTGDVDTSFGEARGTMSKAFDEALANLEELRPGGAAAIARAARAFAPQLSAARQRLIRSGIDPNSLEGNAAVTRVETGRSRAMQDEMADFAEKYVGEKNRLGLSRGSTDVDLLLQRLGMSTDLGREEGSLSREETLRNLAAVTGIDYDRLDRTIGNAIDQMNRTTDYREKRMNLPLTERELSERDFERGAGIEGMEMDEDLLGLNLRNNRFNQGMNYELTRRGLRREAAQGLEGIADTRYNQLLNYLSQAGAFGDQAEEAFERTRQIEAQRGGWWKKLLAGAGMGALSLIPGGGTLSNIIRTVGGGALSSATGMNMPAGGVRPMTPRIGTLPSPPRIPTTPSSIPGGGGLPAPTFPGPPSYNLTRRRRNAVFPTPSYYADTTSRESGRI